MEELPANLSVSNISFLPSLILENGKNYSKRFLEFFTAEIENDHTRKAYFYNIKKFLSFAELNVNSISEISAPLVAAYLKNLNLCPPTKKQHLAAIRMMFDYLVTGGLLKINPASSVKGPKYVLKKGKTPILSNDETRKPLLISPISMYLSRYSTAL